MCIYSVLSYQVLVTGIQNMPERRSRSSVSEGHKPERRLELFPSWH
jgi:hypothetical protein